VLRLARISPLIAAIALGDCHHAIPVETREQAVEIGTSVCDHVWGKLYRPYGVDFRSFNWQAKLINGGDRWDVWVVGVNNSRLRVIVPKSGEAPSTCAMYGYFAK